MWKEHFEKQKMQRRIEQQDMMLERLKGIIVDLHDINDRDLKSCERTLLTLEGQRETLHDKLVKTTAKHRATKRKYNSLLAKYQNLKEDCNTLHQFNQALQAENDALDSNHNTDVETP